ncbi:dTDP-glucose 4,6-dehydratase [Streptomyces sp. NBC_00102]|uniref:dTDP-glucose 4,6-dehydratase n=1 Tax=Streptomyces sp. NBC_00102 TaxID=2975652 RepID=UPI002256FDA0|nr:NAD-dependent epimerase/dehydratase family protein [Streptomyces sp. NBC_00102]MCX5397920.1 GDP-mannose 4,6-dehydratase [Streptomyces sp. NBC_00102]
MEGSPSRVGGGLRESRGGPTRLLVTGGAGFVGSAYVRRLLGPEGPGDVTVTVLDKLTHAGTLTNLTTVLADPRFGFVHGDVCDPAVVARLVARHDEIVHFAAETQVDRSVDGTAVFVSTNVLGTQTLAQAALRGGVRRFVHISTDEVYGPGGAGPRAEDAPLAPASPYSASKASADLIALAHHRTHGLDVRVVRAAGTYGPHQFPEHTVPSVVTRLLGGLDVPRGSGAGGGAGDGRVRDWLHVDDHCRGVELARTRGRPGRTYNLGGGAELSEAELTGLVAEVYGGSPVPRRAGASTRPGDVGPPRAAWSRACSELGYRPRRALPEALAETTAWYRDNRAWWEPLTS